MTYGLPWGAPGANASTEQCNALGWGGVPVPGLAGKLLLVSQHWDHWWQQGFQVQQEHGPHRSCRGRPPLPLCTAGSTRLLQIDANSISFSVNRTAYLQTSRDPSFDFSSNIPVDGVFKVIKQRFSKSC